MDYIVKEISTWYVQDCKDEEEAKQRVVYQKRIGLKDRIIEVVNEVWLENKIGKWVAFTQDGMPCVLHGKVIDTLKHSVRIKCKNGQKRRATKDDIIGFYDTKQKCCAVK